MSLLGRRKGTLDSALNKMQGSRGLHGLSMSEQNHLSALCHLNDCHVKENKYREDAMTLLKDLFLRQKRQATIMNRLLFNGCNYLLNEIKNLSQGVQSNVNRSLMTAAKQLCVSE